MTLADIISKLAHIYDPEFDGKKPEICLDLRASGETIELLKTSDSPFAGFVISCLCDPKDADMHFEDWLNKKLDKIDTSDVTRKTYSHEEVMKRLNRERCQQNLTFDKELLNRIENIANDHGKSLSEEIMDVLSNHFK